MREFCSDGVVYVGFDKRFHTAPHRLALVQDEDVLVVYAVDETNFSENVNSLIRYLRENNAGQIVGFYREDGFLGARVSPDCVSILSRYKQ